VATAPDRAADVERWGLCAVCTHRAVVTSDRGSRFVRCGLARVDPRFAKYPAVPVLRCAGYAAGDGPGEPD
jgi:hypothetical protein